MYRLTEGSLRTATKFVAPLTDEERLRLKEIHKPIRIGGPEPGDYSFIRFLGILAVVLFIGFFR